MAVRGALVVARLADERPGDDTADGVLAREDLAGLAAPFVQLLERDRLLVRCDLEDRVRGRVDDPLAGLLVLLAELLDDLGARGRPVTEYAARGSVHERVDDVVRKTVRVRREGLRRDNAHHLPVPEGRVLALRALEQAARDGRGPRHLRHALERCDVAEPQRLHGR